MKYIFLVIASFVIVPSTYVNGYTLSEQTKGQIQGNALIAGIGSAFVAAILCKENNIKFESYRGLASIIGAGLVGGIIGGCTIYQNSSEKMFERDAQIHLEQARARFEKIITNESIDNLRENKDLDVIITNTKKWYVKTDRDKLYTVYPLVSAHNFLYEYKHELHSLLALYKKLSDYFDQPILTELMQSIKRLERHSTLVEMAIEALDSLKEFKEQYKEYRAFLSKPNNATYASQPQVHPSPKVTPKPVYYPPVVVTQPTSQPTPKPKPVQPAPVAKPVPKPDSTISPVLQGDVYGTIWSNY